MRLGSEQHKELFCHSFIDSHLNYEPEKLAWPNLDGLALERLRGIPFWKEALYTERKAGVMVSAYAKTIQDPLLREAIALQGREESRHARLIEFLIHYYDIQIAEPEIAEIPRCIETAFTDFGFEECLDSFFAFGMFGMARQSRYFPEALFTIFDPILDEEARHIVFFVNWVTYLQIQRGRGWSGWRAFHALWHYGRALSGLIQAFGGGGEREEQAFTATGASTFIDDLTPELFFATCLSENSQRMRVFDRRLLQPQLMPRLSTLALRCLKFLSRRPVPPTAPQG
jgi:hypothetical protein